MAVTQSVSPSVPTAAGGVRSRLDDMPKHFAADGDIVMSHVLAVLSSVFPDGEDYFVRSVGAVRDRIEDGPAREDVEGFIGQESMHGREHRVLNERLAEFGYPDSCHRRPTCSTLRRSASDSDRETANLALTAAPRALHRDARRDAARRPRARAEIGHDGVRDLLHVARARGGRAQGRGVRRLPGTWAGASACASPPCGSTHLTFVLETTIWTLVSLAMDRDARRHPVHVPRSAWRCGGHRSRHRGRCASSSSTTARLPSQRPRYTRRWSQRGERCCSGPKASSRPSSRADPGAWPDCAAGSRARGVARREG